MKTLIIIVLFFITSLSYVFSQASNSPQTLDRKTFYIDSTLFKLKVEQIDTFDYKIRISKKINGKWKLQNRHIKDADGYDGYDILDWNKDGHPDIRVKFITGGSGEYENFLFLYDSISRQHINIKKYWWFCGSYENEKALKDTPNYFFSYISWGCAGDSYQSSLFTIKDYKLIEVGSISINYCEPPYQIIIYKCKQSDTSKGRTQRIATIKAEYIEKHYSSWHDYVENYWNKHYKMYIE